MSWLFELHQTQPVAHAIGALAFLCMLGMTLGSLKFRGIGLGTAGVVFAGFDVGRPHKRYEQNRYRCFGERK